MYGKFVEFFTHRRRRRRRAVPLTTTSQPRTPRTIVQRCRTTNASRTVPRTIRAYVITPGPRRPAGSAGGSPRASLFPTAVHLSFRVLRARVRTTE